MENEIFGCDGRVRLGKRSLVMVRSRLTRTVDDGARAVPVVKARDMAEAGVVARSCRGKEGVVNERDKRQMHPQPDMLGLLRPSTPLEG